MNELYMPCSIGLFMEGGALRPLMRCVFASALKHYSGDDCEGCCADAGMKLGRSPVDMSVGTFCVLDSSTPPHSIYIS